MLRSAAIGFAAAGMLIFGALTPALADVPNCMKYPNAETCPTMGQPTATKVGQGTPRYLRHSHYRSPQAPHKS
jgi:hypothetical protein